MSDVLRAVEEAIERLAYMAQARAENASDRNDARSFHARATISLETLRAALAPVTDEEVAGIEARHLLAEADGWVLRPDDIGRTHRDRATLLRRDAQREAELAAVKAERDRAQRACEQMGERITSLETLIRAMIENEPDDAVSDGGHTVLDLWRHEARAALEPKP